MYIIYVDFYFCRRIIHKKLKEAGIPVPEYAVLNRKEDGTTGKCVCVCMEKPVSVGSNIYLKLDITMYKKGNNMTEGCLIASHLNLLMVWCSTVCKCVMRNFSRGVFNGGFRLSI